MFRERVVRVVGRSFVEFVGGILWGSCLGVAYLSWSLWGS